MRWTNKQEIPVLYRVDADGNEHLVNGDRNKNTMVYYDVAENLRLRLVIRLQISEHHQSLIVRGIKKVRQTEKHE